ncbi:MAG: hypothetical protein IT584_01695, partial [Chlamydiae bacterium]|nr:hypothetical protein [Chlamydiota bacterium]
MNTIPPSSSWIGWWSSIVAESDKRWELEKEKLRAPENPPPPSTSGSTFFSISAVKENLEQIDQEARRRLETKSAQYVPNQPGLSKPVASIIKKAPTLAEPVEPEDQKSSSSSFFSTSLNTVKELCIETEQEAERRFEEENRQASLFSIGADLFTSAIDLVKGAASLAKEATSRPIVIGGTDINYYSLNVEKISEDSQKEMTSRVAAVRKDSLSLEELDIINGEFVEEASFIMESPEIGLSESQEISKSGKEKIEDEIQAFCKPLIAHLTFHLLHEVIAGQKIVPDEQREQLYQTMTRLAIEDSARDDPLWDIYYEHLGKNLYGFAYIKVRVFYLLFYSLSDFIPTLIRECSKHATGTLYEILTDEKQLDQHISTALERAENYLTRLNGSISEFGKQNGKGGNVDTYKKAVVHMMFGENPDGKFEESVKRASQGENLDGTLEELIKRASRKAI